MTTDEQAARGKERLLVPGEPAKLPEFLPGLRADGDPVAREDLRKAVRRSAETAADILGFLRKPAADQPSWLRELLDEWVQRGPDLPSWYGPPRRVWRLLCLRTASDFTRRQCFIIDFLVHFRRHIPAV